ncbi:DUF3846 domain-containing protein [Brevibacillus dissolubilis]|uniref:DUF3846 domain-containing protein n=1 Tax=Brevibacillus dissolubilis TaxID=1844116 RepID=UPI001115B766|nr:hypothetical protein [Brevibacillus dissolubilis]
MIKVIVKIPHEQAEVREVSGAEEIEEILEGDYEVIQDDTLEGISLLVNEDARGVAANNFPVTSDGYLDWVYGPCVMIGANGGSLTDADVERITTYLAKSK